MPDPDRKDKSTSGHTPPIDPPMSEEDRQRINSQGTRDPGATDVGRTSGGGSLGHAQPHNVEGEAPLRNNADRRESDEPTLPSKDASLNTKI